MSKKQFKSQASSSRAIGSNGFGAFSSSTPSSTLSYITSPPKLSLISDANVVVCYKNLLKKDSTTKSKGLEDLRTYVQAHPYENEGGVEEAILDAWVELYPRVSIDDSRRVRELSHILQFELLKSARKRMEKHIPKIVGTWLAGTYDRDRAVSRAAGDGIGSFLDNEKKVALFWKRCQVQILDYAMEAINETPQTLSDERTISTEDAQAKYFRVVGSSLSLVLNLLSKLDSDDIKKYQEEYDKFLSHNKKLWAFVSCEDAFVRRTTSQLLEVCLDKKTATVDANLDIISHAFIAEGLRASQSSSTYQLLQTLTKLTSQFSHVWTTAYKGKKSALSKLRNFVEKGSQGGPADYWTTLTLLIASLPEIVLPTTSEGSIDFMNAFRNGITCREEPRTNAPVAWKAYFQVITTIASRITHPVDVQRFFETSAYAVFRQYLHPTVENSQWNIKGSIGPLVAAYKVCSGSQDSESSFRKEWEKLADEFTERLNTSLPEQSKDYHKSQDAVVAESHRWFSFVSSILNDAQVGKYGNQLVAPSIKIVASAIAAENNRNGKPYSAAATIEAAIRLTPKLFELSPELLHKVANSLGYAVPKLITSPSSKYLLSSLFLLRTLPGQVPLFEEIWRSTLDSLLGLPPGEKKMSCIVALISSDVVSKLCQQNPELQRLFSAYAAKAVHENEEVQAWPLFEAAITFNLLAKQTETQLLDQIIGGLDDQISETRVTSSLKALEFIAKMRPTLLKRDNKSYVTLVTKLLALTELSETDIPSRASLLRNALEGAEKTEIEGEHASPMLHVIRQNLEIATPQSLSVDTLVQQAKSLLDSSEDSSILTSLLPDTSIWKQSLEAILRETPNYALAVMRPFAGAVYLTGNSNKSPSTSTRDLSGYSVALRMAIYTTRLVEHKPEADLPNLDLDILYLLSVTAQLLQDQVDLQEDNKLAAFLGTDIIAELQDFLFLAKSPLYRLASSSGNNWLDGTDAASTPIRTLISKLIVESGTASPKAFHSARILRDLLQRLANDHGWNNVRGEAWLQKLDILKSSTTNVLGAAAILIGLQDVLATSKLVNTFCNRLISDIAGAKATSDKTLSLLVLLNASFSVYEDGDLPVAQNRLIFAVKQILSWTDELPATNPQLASESCFALHRLLPAIKDIYGSYWETALGFCLSIWDSDDSTISSERLPMIGMSLKLYIILRSLKDANDDLVECLGTLGYQISHGLINLLKLSREKENVPLLFVDDMLSREVSKIQMSEIQDFSEFYALIASDHKTVQAAAFGVLHRAIPEKQQQLSVDVILEKRDAHLPEELLSLLLDAPSLNTLPDEVLSTFPSSIRGYLLSWLLVYDSYSTASFKVRSDYSATLKSENYISPLLDFMFDVLGHSAGYPLSLGSFSDEKIRSYTLSAPDMDLEDSEQDLHWLLVHLYYLTLKYTPSLAKTHYMDLRSKQTRLAVESWTSRFFSPLIIADTMTDVLTWAENQEVNEMENEKELIIKVSRKAREVFAGYEVDDTMLQIVIKLPPAYPLDGVKVEGVTRVAVSQQKWTGWLMNTQGAITFSNGSITDSLFIFRKNVIGALKGKAECAICYSLISSDKKMPDKGCHTCKNLFHAGCLFKWFATSNQSTCPLCRNPFNYGVSAGKRGGGGGGGGD